MEIQQNMKLKGVKALSIPSSPQVNMMRCLMVRLPEGQLDEM